MPVRWIVCPMVLVEGPEVGTPDDEGHLVTEKRDRFESKARALVRGRVQVVEHIRVGGQAAADRLCLCQARADDLSPLDADPEIVSVFGEDELREDRQFGDDTIETPRQRGWSQGKVNSVKRDLESLGVDFTGIDVSLDKPKRDILRAIKASIRTGRVR